MTVTDPVRRSGREVKAQVMEALSGPAHTWYDEDDQPHHGEEYYAFADCIVLTREEAEIVFGYMKIALHRPPEHVFAFFRELHGLTPEKP